MTDLLLNSFLVLLTILFGAMAYYPLFLKGNDTQTEEIGEDRVISVVPMGMEPQTPTRIGSVRPADEHPGHVPAA